VWKQNDWFETAQACDFDTYIVFVHVSL